MMRLEDFKEVLDYNLPQLESKQPTLLEIAGMPHYENVDSNILAFFLNPKAEHGLEDLFLRSLVDLCDHKYQSKSMNKDLSLQDPEVRREVTTKKSKRIDISIEDGDTVIMVENKIYHWLANDLDEYWNHYNPKDYPDHRKAGVLLSLHPVQNLDQFVSITHSELNQEVLKNLGSYILRANPKYLNFLFDFIENKNHFYMSDQDKQSFEFIFENRDKIKKIVDAHNGFLTAVLNQVDSAHGPFSMARKTQSHYRYYSFPETSHLYYTILVRHILDSDANYSILLEGNYIEQKDFDELRKLALSLCHGKEHIRVIDSKPSHSWFHLLTIRRDFRVEDLETLGDEIRRLITSEEMEKIRKSLVNKLLELNKDYTKSE